MVRGKEMKKIIIALIIVIFAVGIAALGINFYITGSTAGDIAGQAHEISDDAEVLADLKEFNADCILVLGAGLKPDGTPNHMLQDRLDAAIMLYNAGVASKVLLSGDNGQEEYDEVNAMKAYMLDAGIPLENIFMDHAGFSTYETMYRTKEIFAVESAIVITQEYHQYRALYIAKKKGIEVMGVSSDPRSYYGQLYREIREILARDKDFFKVMFDVQPTYLGDVIPISGNGLASHD